MRRPSLKVVVEIKINTITCPSTRLDPSKWVHLRVFLLGSCVRSRLLKAQFPFQVDEKIRFERTFPLCGSAKHLYSALNGEKLHIELVQVYQMSSKVLALFSGDLNDFIFDCPNIIRERDVRTDNYSLILHTTHHFPGITNPHLNAILTVKLIPVHDCAIEISRDGGYNLTLGLKGSECLPYNPPHYDEPTLTFPSHLTEKTYPLRTCQRVAMSKAEPPRIKPPKRKIFCVRHVDDHLIGRQPSFDIPPTELDSKSKRPASLSPRKVKPFWMKNTFQMDTVSSILRQKPKIVKNTNEFDYDDKSGCTYDHFEPISASVADDSYTPRKHRQSIDFGPKIPIYSTRQIENNSTFFQKHDSATHYDHHDSEICTLCQLYYDYFGLYYPMHYSS